MAIALVAGSSAGDDYPTSSYGWEKMPVPARDAESSYAALVKFLTDTDVAHFDIDGLKFSGWTIPTSTNVLAHADEIEDAWERTADARRVLARLDKFSDIADLSQPPTLEDISKCIATADVAISNCEWGVTMTSARALWRTCACFALLKNEQGEPEKGIGALIQFHSVARKAMSFSRNLTAKMTWLAIAEGNIGIADRIADSPKCTRDMVDGLCKSFRQLSSEELSFRAPLAAQCTLTLMELRDYVTPDNIGAFVGRHRKNIKGNDGIPFQLPPESLRLLCTNLPALYDREESCRHVKAYYDLHIKDAAQCPPDFFASTNYLYGASNRFEEAFERLLNPSENVSRMDNLAGRAMIHVACPTFTKATERMWRVKVRSDLLAVELHDRQGERLVLIDDYTGEPYMKDHSSGAFFSAGPDRQPYTADDITLNQ